MEEEDREKEALGLYCKRVMNHVRRKQQMPGEEEIGGEASGKRKGVSTPRPTGLKERRGAEAGRASGVNAGPSGHRRHDLRFPQQPERSAGEADTTSLGSVMFQGPAARLVPSCLISLVKHQGVKAAMGRAAEVELHDPSVCSVCVQKRADLALNTFIRWKKTQLEAQTLAVRLNTHLYHRDHICLLGEFVRNLPRPSCAPHRIWEELLSGDMRVTATSGCLDNRSETWRCPDNR